MSKLDKKTQLIENLKLCKGIVANACEVEGVLIDETKREDF
jgi:hypothetical protein